MPCPGPQKTQKGRFLALFLLNFRIRLKPTVLAQFWQIFRLEVVPSRVETRKRLSGCFSGFRGPKPPNPKPCAPTQKRKIAILARSYLGRGDLSRAQICAVDVSLRLLLLAKISAQKNQTARKYGPSKIVILGFSAIWAKIGLFGLFSSNQHLTFFPAST